MKSALPILCLVLATILVTPAPAAAEDSTWTDRRIVPIEGGILLRLRAAPLRSFREEQRIVLLVGGQTRNVTVTLAGTSVVREVADGLQTDLHLDVSSTIREQPSRSVNVSDVRMALVNNDRGKLVDLSVSDSGASATPAMAQPLVEALVDAYLADKSMLPEEPVRQGGAITVLDFAGLPSSSLATEGTAELRATGTTTYMNAPAIAADYRDTLVVRMPGPREAQWEARGDIAGTILIEQATGRIVYKRSAATLKGNLRNGTRVVLTIQSHTALH